MSELEHKQTHVAEALARFTEQFKNKPNFQKIVASFVERNQHVEDVSWEMYNARFLDNAADDRLDMIGAVVGESRNGKDDTTYRQYIAARIVINKSDGTADDSLHVLELITPAGSDYDITDVFPAAYRIRLYGYAGDFDTVFDIVRQVKPAGVRLYFEYSPTARTGLFRFAPGSTLVSGSSRGFDDASSPGTAGRLAGVLVA